MKKMIKRTLYLLLFLTVFFVAAAEADVLPLPAEKAFVFSAYLEKPDKLIAEWHIAPGYYLYRDKIRFSTGAASFHLDSILWPLTKTKTDPVRGNFRAYEHLVHIAIPIAVKAEKELRLAVQYQGCSEEGFCYAPVKKQVQVTYPFAAEGLQQAPLLTISDSPPAGMERPMAEELSLKQDLLTQQGAVKDFLAVHAFTVTLLCFLGLGVLLAFTPCSLPMIPILSSIIVGAEKQTKGRAFRLSLSYVLGLALSYAAAGMAVAWLGSSVQVYFQKPWVLSGFSLLFVLLALSLLGLFRLRLPAILRRQNTNGWQQPRGGSYFGVFLMGCFSTLIVSPCVTAPLVGVLAYITETGNLVLGGSALFALGLGMGLPLLLLGFSAGRYLPKAGPWMEAIEKLFAFLLLGMAVWLLSRILPGGLILFLWASLLIAAAIYLFFAESLSALWRYLGYGLGALFVGYAFVLFVGVSMDHSSPFYPFERHSVELASSRPSLDFNSIQSMDQLDLSLKKASQEKKPVLIDFYADWCASCKVLEQEVLSKPEIQQILQHFILLRANVTENNAFDQALLKRYHVLAPPTFLFFNRKGQEVMEKRIVGEVDPRLFLARASAI